MLDVENLSIVYDRVRPPVPAVTGVTFHLSAGDRMGLIGESGCGKTSLGLSIMGLLGDAAVSGSIRFQGHELTSMKASRRRLLQWREIAMVFQNRLEAFNPVIPLGEQLSEPLRTHLRLSARAARERVAELLTLTGLDPDWQTGYAHQLSGGMRQRALIAMALACKPTLLIVDEPTTSLDPESREAIVQLLDSLQQQMGFAMILISHNLPAIRRLSRQLFTLYAGRMVETGMTADVLRNPQHPYTRGLINASADFFPYKDLWGIAGAPPRPGETGGCPFQPRCCQSSEACAQKRPELVHVGVQRQVACHKGGIQTVLQAMDLRKTYRLGSKRIDALQGVSLTVRRGEVVALVGASGSGKSTLAHILVQVLAPDGGEVRFLGQPVSDHAATARMGGMQMVFQDPGEAISHRLTVIDAVREPLDIMGWEDRRTRDEKAVAALSAMQLSTTPDFLHRTCHALSGGQRQRVAIARALVSDPQLLVADEITAMLDPSTQAVILRELKGRQNERGFSLLFISHDIALGRKIADRVYVLNQGRLVDQGAAFEVFGQSNDENRVWREPSAFQAGKRS
ncbi:oligopeptide/dipeptide ABC transporter ATP-binding protein [Desulfosarcina ovata]|uniref:ABC transporter ATP-binding protein n=1 Tax=Desulfosarcina ovata subsp. ovata TaxID=2752305 RepID=A0A5K8A5T7_9BACT|nr:ABC transporter ATP-binding protein [Desulfosarcina ovata]BBO87867.1 ABC transporter ATP-binding protein [Desulfosarcina ovata subsp. ovata]